MRWPDAANLHACPQQEHGQDSRALFSEDQVLTREARIPRGGGGTPLYGMCGPGYGFSAVLVLKRVSILAGFGHFGPKSGVVFAL